MRMKLFTIAAITLLLALGADAQTGRPAKPDPTAPVKEAFEVLLGGIRTADAAKVMSVYHSSSDTLFFNNNGTVTLGWEQMKSNRESAYAKVSNVTLETSGVRIRMLGAGAAYVTCKWKQTQDSEGRTESAAGRVTLIFQLIQKEWKVVHAHTSPDAPDAARPVMTSERNSQ